MPAGSVLRLAPGDAHFPERLREIPRPPRELHVEGRAELLGAPSIAIVGSRNCTYHGAQDAHDFALELSKIGYCIVSGLARGVDEAAHRGALKGVGSSIAVLGTGIDRHYPVSNRALSERLRKEGCVISEFPRGTPPLPENFPQRNRLISGLVLGVLVVEATEGSGSLITAEHAANQGRDVFAIPGSIHSTLSKGCHKLIRDGAVLVENTGHLLDVLGWRGHAHAPAQAALPLSPAPDESDVLKALGHAPMSMDQVAVATGWPVGRVAAELSRLEVARYVLALPGGWYQRSPQRSTASPVIE
jgi:DNA processing protein